MSRFESVALIGDRVVLITDRTVVLMHLNENGVIQCENMQRPLSDFQNAYLASLDEAKLAETPVDRSHCDVGRGSR